MVWVGAYTGKTFGGEVKKIKILLLGYFLRLINSMITDSIIFGGGREVEPPKFTFPFTTGYE